MIWLQSGLLYLHILGAIFWFGSGLTFQLVIVPALEKTPYEGQKPFLASVGGGYGRVVGPIAGLTILLGILRGISTGVLGILNTAYGVTWLLAMAGGLLVIFVGMRFVGPTAARMGAAGSREEVLAEARGSSATGRSSAAGCSACSS